MGRMARSTRELPGGVSPTLGEALHVAGSK